MMQQDPDGRGHISLGCYIVGRDSLLIKYLQILYCMSSYFSFLTGLCSRLRNRRGYIVTYLIIYTDFVALAMRSRR